MYHERSLSPIPRSQDWACGPSAFLYGYCILKDCLLGYFSRSFVVMWWIVFFKGNRKYFSKPMRLSSFLKDFYQIVLNMYFSKLLKLL